jgi:hypothetical protein
MDMYAGDSGNSKNYLLKRQILFNFVYQSCILLYCNHVIYVQELLGPKPKGGPSHEPPRRGRSAVSAVSLEDHRLVTVQFMVINKLKVLLFFFFC